MRLLLILKIAGAMLLPIATLTGCDSPSNMIELDVAGYPFMVEIANTPELRGTGLMHRQYLADDAGMLFIFERSKILYFWMKNTLIPLSIAFISDNGRILEIRDMSPHDLTRIISKQPVRYALEVKQGAFKRNGIKPGDKIDIIQLKELKSLN